MARRVSWTNNSSGHSGTYVYRAPTLDPLNLPVPVATVGPVAQGLTSEWVDAEELAAGDYDYAVQDFDGQGVSQVSAVSAHTVAADLSTAVIGDQIEGGIYAGIHTIGTTDYYIIASLASAEVTGLAWKTSDTATAGTDNNSDGFANTQAIITAGITDHPSAEHCVGYSNGGHSDWYLPAIEELRLVFANLSGHPELEENNQKLGYTWASSTRSATRADVKRQSDGDETSFGAKKTETAYRHTRPIRRVPV